MQKLPGGGGKLEPVEVTVSTSYWEELHVRYDRLPKQRGDRPIYFWYTWDGVFRRTPSQQRGFTREESELKGDADRVVDRVFNDLG